MGNKIKIPKWIQFKIYLSLLITLTLFISVYYALYYIGSLVSEMWEISSTNLGGWIFVGFGVIPLIVALSTKFQDEGYNIHKDKFPNFVKAIREVSERIGVKMPDEIQILPTEEIYVTGLFKRKLGVGIVGLRSLSSQEFKSILAHEFGHLYGKDTIIGSFLARIHLSLEKSSNFGKAWWNVIPFAELAVIGLFITAFAKSYSFIFKVIISIYSRQVEYRADYVASQFADKETFGRGLVNYSAYSTYFEQVGYNSVVNLLSQGRQFVNVYQSVYMAYLKEDHKNIKQTIIENEKSKLFSSHPPIRNRLKTIGISNLNLKSNDKKDASSLLDHREQLEKEMTLILTRDMHVNILYADAVAREGKCKYCGEQFEQLQGLLEHEEKCEGNK